MGRKKFSCDFETTTKLDDCRVWAYGWMEIGKKSNYDIGNNIDDFMKWCEGIKADLYFHNLRFDGEFIVNWLLKNGFKWEKTGRAKTFHTLISSMGQWYAVEICYGYKGRNKLHTIIYDSLKKLPFTVKKIAQDFGMEVQKGDIDYHKERPIGYEPDEVERKYIKGDIEIIADALEIQFKQGLTKITNGSDSLDGFKALLGSKMFERFFPILSLELDANLRLAYRGGFTWLNGKYEGVTVCEGKVFDVNSLYPSMMYDRDLPYGMPLYFEGEYREDKDYPLYIQHIRCEFELKEGRIPTIQIKRNMLFRQNEYLKNSNGEVVDLYVTNVDLVLMSEHYHLYELEFLEGWKFKSVRGLFKQFIDKWTFIKINNTGAIRLLAKLMLNALYGKFATNPDVTGKIPYLKEDGSCGFKIGEEEYRNPVYTPVGVFITSWARDFTIRTAQKCYNRIIYCDTDSIHIEGIEIPETIKDIVDPKRMGFWKLEEEFIRAKYLRQKTYVQELIEKPYIKRKGVRVIETNLKLSVKCAGMPDKVKEKVTFENFQVGFSRFGKLLPKHVNGGVVLVDTEFTIK